MLSQKQRISSQRHPSHGCHPWAEETKMSNRAEEVKTGMTRRSALKTLAVASVAGVIGVPALAQANLPRMVTVAKIIGVPWFNLLSAGIAAGGNQFHIDTSMIGPAHPDPAVQV